MQANNREDHHWAATALRRQPLRSSQPVIRPSPDPGDAGAQNLPICAPRLVISYDPPGTDRIGGSASALVKIHARAVA
jgi:hypothetical protein